MGGYNSQLLTSNNSLLHLSDSARDKGVLPSYIRTCKYIQRVNIYHIINNNIHNIILVSQPWQRDVYHHHNI
jgi:hypothetical protein